VHAARIHAKDVSAWSKPRVALQASVLPQETAAGALTPDGPPLSLLVVPLN